MKRIARLVLVLGLFAAQHQAQAQQPEAAAGKLFVTGEAGEALTFVRPSMPPSGAVKPQVTNGKIVDNLAAWPATLFAVEVACTATIVGPRVILLAAHCLKYKSATKVGIAGTNQHLKCELDGNYNNKYDELEQRTDANWDATSRDYALCALALSSAPNFPPPYETLMLGSVVSVNDRIRLLGYGCDGDKVLAGTLRTGTGVTYRLPNGDNNFLELRGKNTDNAILCKGDSGGAAFWRGDSETDRRIIGVNSRVGTDDDKASLTGSSFVSSLSTPAARKLVESFAKKWAICGAPGVFSGCR